jgi:Ca2+-binding EF-hand superfamily protein
MLKRKYQLFYVNNEQKSEVNESQGGDEELELSEFKKMFDHIIKIKLPDEVKERFFRVITDSKQEYVSYEKFNRLCDLFFFHPGHVHKSKNESP